VRRRLQAGETLPAGQFAAALADWFPAHVQYLDSALAQWICKHTWNAKPVVLHRHKPVAQVMSHS
jgi:hemerythrin